ncbi:MAG: amidohydrolase family protein [Oscillospiraceae bacterium]|nr:amidohydrolase family protein [Oscillospiraceae bacterium]
MRVADVHTHIFPDKIAQKASTAIGEFYNVDIHHTASVSVLTQAEAQADIEFFAACSAATCPEQVDHLNSFVAASVESTPNMIGFGSLFPGMDRWEPALEQLIALGIHGVKIHPDFQKVNIDEPKAVEMYRAIAKAGLPVLFHMGDNRYDFSAPERLTNLIRQVPDLTAIAAHFGGWQAWDRAAAHVLPENVYYDTSSSLMFLGKERALDLLDKMGPHRFLFGSDFPMWTPKEELQRFLQLGLDESTNKTILFGNFEKLFLK